MSVFKRWIDRLFGMQVEVEHQVEQAVRTNTALAGAVIRAQAAAEARAYAAEIQATNPELAAAILAAIAEQTAAPPGAVALSAAPTPEPAQLPAAAGKRSPGRPRKVAQLPSPNTQPERSQP